MAIDDNFSKVLLHLNGTDGSTTITDESGKTWTAEANAQIDTAQSKFSGASLLLDGSGDDIYTADSADFDTGTGDFTADFWVRFNSVADCGFFAHGLATSNRNMLILEGNQINWVVIIGGSTLANYRANWTPSANTWYHVALVRSGSTVYMFIDGVSQAVTTVTSAGNITGIAENFYVGNALFNAINNYLNGWIDEFRFSVGVARWTANFTPPTTEYAPSSAAQVIWFS